MRRMRIEIQVTLLAIFILVVVFMSVYLVYQSLSQIVNSIHKEARPDTQLIWVKEVASQLTEVENTVKIYTLSNDKEYLDSYESLNLSIEEKLDFLQSLNSVDEQSQVFIDSMEVLTIQKLEIWSDMLDVHFSKADASTTFSEYYEKLDTTQVVKDTLYFEEPVQEQKKGIFRKIFGGKKKEKVEPKPIIVDKVVPKENIKAEIEAIEEEIAANTQLIAERETELLQENILVTGLLQDVITKLEQIEQQKLIRKTQDADLLADITYKRLAMFTGAAVVLMILVLLLFYRDVRKSRSYQRILQKAKIEAEKLARAKELFVATVSHEMRNPVNAIYGLTEQLLRRRHDSKTQKDIDVIHKSTRHLITLVNDTFDFSKIENQKLQLEPVDFLLDELLDDLIIYNKRNALQKGIQLVLDKEGTDGLVVFADPVRIKQILLNLLTNAIKFTDEGKVILKVRRDDYSDSVTLNFDIIDTGIGIPEGNLELIFKDFVQLETDVNKKSEGTGLGLYLVKRLVDLLGGIISVKSQQGVGTTFTFNLPVPKGNPINVQSLKPGVNIPEELKKINILIVDDEEFNRHFLKNILNNWGLKYTEVVNGREAVDITGQQTFDLILMDIRMPEMNGFEAAERIKARNYPAKIIALTADKQDGNLKKYEDAGFDSFLHKPFAEKDLLKTIQESLGASEAEEEQIQKETDIEKAVSIEDLEQMANGDRIFMREMITIFISTNRNNMESLLQNLDAQNWDEIADIAHKMATPAKHMNLKEIYSRIKKIQELAENGHDQKEITSHVSFLQEEMNAVNKYFSKLLTEMDA